MLDEVEADLVDRFGDYPDEVANLLNIGQIKMDGDRALVEGIQKRQQQIIFTLSKVGTKAYKVEQLFEALSATKMKATLGVEKDHMVIKLVVEKIDGRSDLAKRDQQICSCITRTKSTKNRWWRHWRIKKCE